MTDLKTLTLTKGLTVGETTHKDVSFRDLSAGDIIDATLAGERAVATPAGWMLLPSDTLVGVELLRRQIGSIGTHQGPLSLEELRMLSGEDLAALQARSQALDVARATTEAATTRGRSEGGRPSA